MAGVINNHCLRQGSVLLLRLLQAMGGTYEPGDPDELVIHVGLGMFDHEDSPRGEATGDV